MSQQRSDKHTLRHNQQNPNPFPLRSCEIYWNNSKVVYHRLINFSLCLPHLFHYVYFTCLSLQNDRLDGRSCSSSRSFKVDLSRYVSFKSSNYCLIIVILSVLFCCCSTAKDTLSLQTKCDICIVHWHRLLKRMLIQHLFLEMRGCLSSAQISYRWWCLIMLFVSFPVSGRFLHGNVTLSALSLPLGRTCVMHLVQRENLPDSGNNQDSRLKSKERSTGCCSSSCSLLWNSRQT